MKCNYALTGMSAATAIAVAALGASMMAAAEPARVPGDQFRWTLDFKIRLEQSGAKPVNVQLSGDWVSTISAVRPGAYDAELQLAGVRLNGDQTKTAPPAAMEDLRRRLERPFWATYRNDGAMAAVHFFKDMAPADRNLLQMIATELQVVQPDSQRGVWTVEERDGAGSYVAMYRRDGGALIKRKLKYIYTDGVAGAPVNGMFVNVESSEMRFFLDADGAVRAAEGNNRVRMGVPLGEAEDMAASTEIRLSNARLAHAPDQAGSLARALSTVDTSAVVTQRLDPAEQQARSDDRLLEGRTTESLLSAAMSTAHGDSDLPIRLTALFRRRPEAIAQAERLLRKSGGQRLFDNALAAAGSPAAIETLGGLARDRALPEPLRIDALNAFAVVQHPSVEAMRIPVSLLDDANPRVIAAAELAAGTLAHAGRAEHPSEAEAIDAELIARYRKVQEPRQACDFLAALGNSAGPATAPVIRGALRDTRPDVRGAAARALRLAHGEEIDHLLASIISSDRDAHVRADAILAASFRHPLSGAVGEALVTAARKDAADYVRSDAIGLLRQNPAASPHTAETLAWVSKHDVKPGIRQIAREALAAIQ